MQSLQTSETIVVTGASGLVGAHILRRLKPSDARIVAACRRIPEGADNRFDWVECDILDVCGLENLFAGVDKVYHCAAIVSYDPRKRKDIFQTNVEGTANVVNAALSANVKRLLHVSSVSAIGEPEKSKTMIDESLAWKDAHVSDYSKSKHLAEMEVWRGLSEGLSAVVVNPSIVLGCGDWNKGSTEIFKTIYNEFPWYSEGVHGFVDVDDVALAAVSLMNSDIEGERFILNGLNLSYKDLFNKIAHAFGTKPPYKKVTPFLSEIVWRASYIKGLLNRKPSMLTKHSARIALSDIRYDNNKLLQFLPGFRYTDIDETIDNICKCLKMKYGL